MRHLVYLLLVANLVYFGWNLYEGGTAAETVRVLPPLPASAKRLVTLQEMVQQSGTDTGKELNDFDGLTMTQPPGAGKSAACEVLGPFHAEDELYAIAGELGLPPRKHITEERIEDGYWVYLPAMEHAQALQIGKQLDDRNDHEYYIGKDNFMSLGTFKERSRAEIRLRQLQKMGMDAILKARYTTQDAYWLEFSGQGAAAPVLNEVMGAHPDLRLRTLACR